MSVSTMIHLPEVVSITSRVVPADKSADGKPYGILNIDSEGSMLSLFVKDQAQVRDLLAAISALGYNLDAGWTQLQREYPPVAVFKVRGHLMNLHMRDIDGRMRQFPHIGQGVMDFKGIVDALKAVNFDGYASIEQDKHPGDMK